MESIASVLGAGSGIDTNALINNLIEAQFAAKNTAFENRQEKLTAQISGVSNLKNGITGFATALSQLVIGGSLTTQTSSANTGIVRATSIAGANLASVNASIEVRQLAAAQTAFTGAIADSSAAVGQGTLTLTLGTASVTNGAMTGFTAGAAAPIDITIDASNSSLTGIRDAINAAGAGVTASIVSDSDGARLILKGASGAAQAFTLDVAEDSGAPGLSSLAVGVGASGTTIGTASKDAIVAVDGVALKRSSNSVTDLIPGVRLDLVSASVGASVAIGSSPQTGNLRTAVNDVITTFNELLTLVQSETNAVTGSLRGDTAAKALLRSMGQLTLAQLIPPNGTAPTTLADLGVGTNRDGSLSVDAARLSSVLARDPASVAKIFSAGAGLSTAIYAISTAATNRTSGLGASQTRYEAAQTKLTDEQARAADFAETERTRLTRQFAGSEARVAAYRSTQDFLTQQIDAWNNNN